MINALLLCLSVALGSGKNLISKFCPQRKIFIFNAIAFAVAFICILIIGLIGGITVNGYIILFAALYALFTMLAQICYIKAVAVGDFSISSLMYSCGFMIPSIFGAIIYHEKVTAFQIVGFIVILASFIIGNLKREKGKTGFKWLILSVSAMICSGIVGLLQKIFRNSNYAQELDSLLVFAFIFISLVSVILHFILARKPSDDENSTTDERSYKFILLIAIIMGVVLCAQNKTNLYLSGAMSSMIFFPVCNGGTIVVSALLDKVILKKELTVYKIVSVALGVVGIVLTVL